MQTVLREVTPETYRAIVDEAASALRSGNIVALPTETVYGLGANMNDPDAVKRLVQLKNRPRGKPFTLHIADQSEVFKYTPGTNRFAHKLINRYWPGPLTLVMNSLEGQSVGVRVPGLELTRDIIRASAVPVIMPSANPAGVSPACAARQVKDFYGGEIELIVDNGPTKICEPSTVVRITDDAFTVIRTGIISESDIINTACTKILFLCTGNTCRSPMAEGICKKLLADKLHCGAEALPNRGYLIQSGGLTSFQGEKASLNAIKGLTKWKIDITGHRTCPVTLALVDKADRIYCMTAAHQAALWELMGSRQDKIELLDRRGRDILDPFGGSESVYSRCASQIYTNLLDIVETL